MSFFYLGQELGNEFQQDIKIIPASCCNLLVLHSVILGALCQKSLLPQPHASEDTVVLKEQWWSLLKRSRTASCL